MALSQAMRARGLLSGVFSLAFTLVACDPVVREGGRQAGRLAAIADVERESQASGAPTGLLGAKWLMSLNQVKAAVPGAVEINSGNLKTEAEVFQRPAFVDFMFTNDYLLIIIVYFKGAKTPETYSATQHLLEAEYGPFLAPTPAEEHIRSSKKQLGRIVV